MFISLTYEVKPSILLGCTRIPDGGYVAFKIVSKVDLPVRSQD